jgi:pimeloyl-ACP methyl ester carboxylesterase
MSTLVVGAVVLALLTGFVTYASIPMAPEATPLADTRADSTIRLTEAPDGVVLTPVSGATGTGLVFFAGARVDPAAYAYKLAGLADAGITVVIARPILNFAILEWRPLSTFTGLAPGVSTWYVGGHSLGGVRACQYAKDDYRIAGLVLLGSYCSADLSKTSIPVVSIGGTRDGLSTPQKIQENAHLLPADTKFIEIEGADHASFGNYGAQPGDNPATTRDPLVRAQLVTAILTMVN